MSPSAYIKKYWFMAGLLAVSLLATADITGYTVNAGLWLKANHGPDGIIFLIFLLSGIGLDMGRVRSGFSDISGTLTALAIIFIAGPALGLLFHLLPLSQGIILGILLVAAMPTTLSSGVVMTGSAGGNEAHALLITILANSLAVFTIPITLGLMLSISGESRTIEIAQLPIMLKIAKLVLAPLLMGIFARRAWNDQIAPLLPRISTFNQLGILTVVWMGVCQGREAIINDLSAIVLVIAVSGFYHFGLLATGFIATTMLDIGKKRRESVILMGGQKTLPLSIILQVSLFPEYGLALAVCVIHHIVHLAMDALVVTRLRQKE